MPKVSTSSLTHLSASELSQMMRAKQISPVEVMDAYLTRVEQLNPSLHAFVHIDAEDARATARRAEDALMRGENSQPLLGVPLSVKSCIDVQGLRCEAGSKLRDGYVASGDAPLIARLKRSGAIVMGNTNTPEMLMAYHTDNDIFGRTNNPWALSRTPGGSSGGEAAAIAACLSAGGIGSDGGGSIRVPAHFSGICGLKPTPGRISASGHFPPCGGPFSLIGVVGPMARTVQDLKLLLKVTAGFDTSDPVSWPLPLDATNELQAKELHIGFYEDDGYSPPTAETRAAVRAAADHLSKEGFRVDAFRPDMLDRARELWFVIFVQAGGMMVKAASAGREQEISGNSKEFLALAAQSGALSGERLLTTLIERDQLRLRLLQQMEKFPILLAPACSIPAFRHEDAGWGDMHKANYLQTMTYSQHYNLLGNPAAVVPVGASPEGLPIGVQVIGRPYKEDEVLAVAAALDQEFGWQPPKI